MEEQLKAAIQANMTEMELFHKQEEFERLQLELEARGTRPVIRRRT